MQSFHDWFIVGVAVDMDAHELTIQLCDDYKKRFVTIYFEGATRFVIEGFSAQNVVYSLNVLSENSTEYVSARKELERAHPWGDIWPMKAIATISASLGAEATIEFDNMRSVEVGTLK
ncbi:hypothetical protein [Paraburkholderia bannensis]|uniref:hypothetical protein n=1 Tax=Paraburkholderia bannensis TaxID=765414 RepID=UPI002AB75D46|nr:hypothetical protein [Paraburkholderia bannensis]